jgi:hypothetical protein
VDIRVAIALSFIGLPVIALGIVSLLVTQLFELSRSASLLPF